MKIVRTSDPGNEPITTAEAKTHLRVENTDSDTYIGNLVTVARQVVEEQLNRGFINQTWKFYLDEFPVADFIELARSPLSSVTSVKYNDEDGTEQTFAATNYIVDSVSEPGIIRLGDDASWPDSRGVLNDVVVEYVVGYGANASDVPEIYKHIIKLVLSDLYVNREDVPKAKLTAVARLKGLYKVWYV